MKKKVQRIIIVITTTILLLQIVSNLSMITIAEEDITPPTIFNIRREREYILAEIPTKIRCEVNDTSKIEYVKLYYSVDGKNYSTLMYIPWIYEVYEAEIPGLQLYSNVTYWIEAKDQNNNIARSQPVGPLKVEDGWLPSITGLEQSPSVVTNLNTTTISAYITDNVGVEWVKLTYFINDSETPNIVNMQKTSGIRYEGTIGPQSLGTKIKYYVSVKDTSPVNNIKNSQNYTYYITDGIHPYVSYIGAFPQNPMTNEEFTLKCEAWDETGLQEVITSVRINYGSWTNYTMTKIQGENVYTVAINGQSENTRVDFYFIAIDNSPLQLSANTETFYLTIEDSIKPKITNIANAVPTGIVGGWVQVNATIIDSSEISKAIVYYTFDNGSEIVTKGYWMTKYNDTNVYKGYIESQNIGKTCTYWIYAQDIHGNEATSENITITFIDGLPPRIYNVQILPINDSFIRENTSVLIQCQIEDENNVTVQITVQVKDYFQLQTLETWTTNMDEIGNNTWQYVISPQQATAKVNFVITATDNSTTQNKEDYSNVYSVIDEEKPQILQCTATPTDQDTMVDISLHAIDNGELYSITYSLGIYNNISTNWLIEYVKYVSGQEYQKTEGFPINLKGYTDYYLAVQVETRDLFGHITEEVYKFLITDASAPNVYIVKFNETISSSDDFYILINATDYSGILSARLIYSIDLGIEYYIEMTQINDSYYYALIPSYVYNFEDLLIVKVEVIDNLNNKYLLETPIQLIVGDGDPPLILENNIGELANLIHGYQEQLTFYVKVIDASELNYVYLYYEIQGEMTSCLPMEPYSYGSYNYKALFSVPHGYNNVNIHFWIESQDIYGSTATTIVNKTTISFKDIYVPNAYISIFPDPLDLINNDTIQINCDFTDDVAVDINKAKLSLYYNNETIINLTYSNIILNENSKHYIVSFLISEVLKQQLTAYIQEDISLFCEIQDFNGNKFTSNSSIISVIDTDSPNIDENTWEYNNLSPNELITIWLPRAYDVTGIKSREAKYNTSLNTAYISAPLNWDATKNQYYIIIESLPALTEFKIIYKVTDNYDNVRNVSLRKLVPDLAPPSIISINYPMTGDNTQEITISTNVTDDGDIQAVFLILTKDAITYNYSMVFNSDTQLYEKNLQLDYGNWTCYIHAVDICNKYRESNPFSFEILDGIAPTLESILPTINPIDGTDFIITVTTKDNIDVTEITVTYKINTDEYTYTVTNTEIATITIQDSLIKPFDTIEITSVFIKDNYNNFVVITANLPSWEVIDKTPPIYISHSASENINSSDPWSCSITIEDNDITHFSSLLIMLYLKHYTESTFSIYTVPFKQTIDTFQAIYELTLDPPTGGWLDGVYEYYFELQDYSNNKEHYPSDAPSTTLGFSVNDNISPEVTDFSHTDYNTLQSGQDYSLIDLIFDITLFETGTGIDINLPSNAVSIQFLTDSSSWIELGKIESAESNQENYYLITYKVTAIELDQFVSKGQVTYKIIVTDVAGNSATITSYQTDTFSFELQDYYAPKINSVKIKVGDGVFSQWLSTVYVNYNAELQVKISISDHSNFGIDSIFKIILKYPQGQTHEITQDSLNIQDTNQAEITFDVSLMLYISDYMSCRDTATGVCPIDVEIIIIDTHGNSNENNPVTKQLTIQDRIVPQLDDNNQYAYFSDENGIALFDDDKKAIFNSINYITVKIVEISEIDSLILILTDGNAGHEYTLTLSDCYSNTFDSNNYVYTIIFKIPWDAIQSLIEISDGNGYHFDIVLEISDKYQNENTINHDTNFYTWSVEENYEDITINEFVRTDSANTIDTSTPFNVRIKIGNVGWKVTIALYAEYILEVQSGNVISQTKLLTTKQTTCPTGNEITIEFNQIVLTLPGQPRLYFILDYNSEIEEPSFTSKDKNNGYLYVVISDNTPPTINEITAYSSSQESFDRTFDTTDTNVISITYYIQDDWIDTTQKDDSIQINIEYNIIIEFYQASKAIEIDTRNQYEGISIFKSSSVTFDSNDLFASTRDITITIEISTYKFAVDWGFDLGLIYFKIKKAIESYSVSYDNDNNQDLTTTFQDTIGNSIEMKDPTIPNIFRGVAPSSTYVYDGSSNYFYQFSVYAEPDDGRKPEISFYWKTTTSEYHEVKLNGILSQTGEFYEYEVKIATSTLGANGIYFYFKATDNYNIRLMSWDSTGLELYYDGTIVNPPTVSTPMKSIPVAPSGETIDVQFIRTIDDDKTLSQINDIKVEITITTKIGNLAVADWTTDYNEKFSGSNILYFNIYYYLDPYRPRYVSLEDITLISVSTKSITVQLIFYDALTKVDSQYIDDTISTWRYYINIHYHYDVSSNSNYLGNQNIEFTIEDSDNLTDDWEAFSVVDDVPPKITDIEIFDSSNTVHSISETYTLKFSIYEANTYTATIYLTKGTETQTISLSDNDGWPIEYSNSKSYSIDIIFTNYFTNLNALDSIVVFVEAVQGNNVATSSESEITFDDTEPTTFVHVDPDINSGIVIKYNTFGDFDIYIYLHDSDSCLTDIQARIDISFTAYGDRYDHLYVKHINNIIPISKDYGSSSHDFVFKFTIYHSYRVSNNFPLYQDGMGSFDGTIDIILKYGKSLENTKSFYGLAFRDNTDPIIEYKTTTTTANIDSEFLPYLVYKKWSPPYGLLSSDDLTTHLVKLQYIYSDTYVWVDASDTFVYYYPGDVSTNNPTRWRINYHISYDQLSYPDLTMQYRFSIYSQDHRGVYYTSWTTLTWKDYTSPTINSISRSPSDTTVSYSDSVTVTATLSDNYKLHTYQYIQYYWSGHGSELSPYTATMTKISGNYKSGTWSGTIPATKPDNAVWVYYRIKAKDTSGNTIYSPWYSYHSYTYIGGGGGVGFSSVITPHGTVVIKNLLKESDYTNSEVTLNETSFEIRVKGIDIITHAMGVIITNYHNTSATLYGLKNTAGDIKSINVTLEGINKTSIFFVDLYGIDSHGKVRYASKVLNVSKIKLTIKIDTTPPTTYISLTQKLNKYLVSVQGYSPYGIERIRLLFKTKIDDYWQFVDFIKQENITYIFSNIRYITEVYAIIWRNAVFEIFNTTKILTLLPIVNEQNLNNNKTMSYIEIGIIFGVTGVGAYMLWVKNRRLMKNKEEKIVEGVRKNEEK